MDRYKKAKTEELAGVAIAPDQMEVQNDEGEVIVIATANFLDHERLGWIAVTADAPVTAPVSDELPLVTE